MVQSLTVGICLFVAGFVFTAVRKGQVRVFAVGVCAGAASLSQYAVIGVSTVAAAGLLLLVLAPICGLAGSAAGMFVALALRGDAPAVDE